MTTATLPAPASGRVVPVVSILAMLALWEIAARLWGGAVLLAGPGAIAVHAAENIGLLARATGTTLKSAVLGFFWGNLAAMALAAAVTLAPRSERLVSALALLVFCLPLVATGPILRVLYGPGDGPQVTLAALAVYYTTYVPLVVGLRAVPIAWLDLVRLQGRGAWTQLIRVRAMASLPYLVAGLQIAAPAAILGAMVGEFTGAERGLGVLTIRAMRALDVEATWTIATLAALASMVAYGVFGALGRRLSPDAPALLLAPPVAAARRGPLAVVTGVAAVTLIALAAWQGAMWLFDLSPFFAKRPGDVVAYLLTGPDAAAHRAALFAAYAQTLAYALPGYLAGLALGAGLACALVLAPGLAPATLPPAIALRSVPIVTTAPLIVLALGRGAVGTVVIVAVMIFFPTFVACMQGLRRAPGQITDIFASYAAPRWRLLLSARIPAMWPAFFAAARMGVPAAILAVTTAEWLATGNGIGALMALTASTSDYGMLWSTIVLVGVTAALAHAAVATIERAVLARYAPEQAARG